MNYAGFDRSCDKYAQEIGFLCQDLVRAAADDDAGAFCGDLLYDFSLGIGGDLPYL
jgi:hypothetical protein